MPIPGQKLYAVEDGKLQSVVFLEENLSTYRVKAQNKQVFATYKDRYQTDEKDAWTKVLKAHKTALQVMLNCNQPIEHIMVYATEIIRIQHKLTGLGPSFNIEGDVKIENINHPDDWYIYFQGGNFTWNVNDPPIGFWLDGQLHTIRFTRDIVLFKQKVESGYGVS